MDLDALLRAMSEDAPSGENLEYDSEFIDLEIAAQPGEERQSGDQVIEAEGPDFNDVVTRALAVLERSHDLRAASYLAWAELNKTGLTGFADAVAYIRGCLEQHWATCHPELDADDDDDPTMRVNAVLTLVDNDRTLRSLRLAPLTDSRAFGRMTLRDIQIAEGEAEAPSDMDPIPDAASVSAAFQDTDTDALSAIGDAVARASADVEAIGSVFDDRTPGLGPDLSPLLSLLTLVQRKLANYGVSEAPAEDAEQSPEGDTESVQQTAPGGVNSRADVLNTLDRIIEFYRKNEPSSPVPMLLERAKRLVGADFIAIVEDLAPTGMESVRNAGGIKDT